MTGLFCSRYFHRLLMLKGAQRAEAKVILPNFPLFCLKTHVFDITLLIKINYWQNKVTALQNKVERWQNKVSHWQSKVNRLQDKVNLWQSKANLLQYKVNRWQNKVNRLQYKVNCWHVKKLKFCQIQYLFCQIDF